MALGALPKPNSIFVVPVIPVADTTGLVEHADAALVVVRVGSTARSALTSTVARPQSVDTRVVGVVANGARTDGGDGYYAPKERRGLRRRSQAVELLDVPVKTAQPMGALARNAPGAPANSSRHERGRLAQAGGSLAFAAWPEAGVKQDPPAVGQA